MPHERSSQAKLMQLQFVIGCSTEQVQNASWLFQALLLGGCGIMCSVIRRFSLASKCFARSHPPAQVLQPVRNRLRPWYFTRHAAYRPEENIVAKPGCRPVFVRAASPSARTTRVLPIRGKRSNSHDGKEQEDARLAQAGSPEQLIRSCRPARGLRRLCA